MNDLNKLINEIISENQEINEEIELLDFKYNLTSKQRHNHHNLHVIHDLHSVKIIRHT